MHKNLNNPGSNGWFSSSVQPKEQKMPEKNLFRAILVQALRDCFLLDGTRPEHEKTFNEVRQWFESDDREKGSFLWICHCMDYNPEPIREFVEKTLKMPPKKRKKYANKVTSLHIPH